MLAAAPTRLSILRATYPRAAQLLPCPHVAGSRAIHPSNASARALHLPSHPLGVSLSDPSTYAAKRERGVQALLDLGYPLDAMLEHRIAWRDHDAFAHVNNKHALAHFEDGRAVWMQTIARQCSEETQRNWRGGGKGISLILHSSSVRWKRAMAFPDTILIGTKPTSLQSDRFNLSTVVWSFEQEAITTTGESTICTYDYNRACKANAPDDVRKAIEAQL